MLEEVSRRLDRKGRSGDDLPAVPIDTQLSVTHRGLRSTQQTFGTLLTAVSRDCPQIAKRILTLSPDVASSTNLGGWINKTQVWCRHPREELPDPREKRSLIWTESELGQHIELGISENNLFMALGQFGLSKESFDQTLFPIGTLYDPFVRRGLDAFFFGLYSGSRFIVVGTPSGVTLASEGGIHQSMLTPSIGTELPGISFFEPCFGQELEWILMDALEKIRLREGSTYLRLTTKPVDQALFSLPDAEGDIERLRRQVLQGGYRLIDARDAPDYDPGRNVIHLFASGSMIPEARAAMGQLEPEGIRINLFNVTGPGPLYRSFNDAIRSAADGEGDGLGLLGEMVPEEERVAPVVTVVDGHPHSLAWIGGALGSRIWPLGVAGFGQSGNIPDVYRHHHIDAESIAAACRRALQD